MTGIRPMSDDEMGVEATNVCAEFQKLMQQDRVPQFFRYLAHQPQQLQLVWQQIKGLMNPQAPDHKQKHFIALAVCAASGSSYFAEHHSRALRREGASEAEIAEILAVAQLWSGLSTFGTGLQLSYDDQLE